MNHYIVLLQKIKNIFKLLKQNRNLDINTFLQMRILSTWVL